MSVNETLVHDHLIEGCCEVCGLIFKSFLTWKSVYNTLVSYHSKEVYACPLYEFQPFSCCNIIWESPIVTFRILAQVVFCVIFLSPSMSLSKRCVTCQNLTLTVPLEMKAFEQIFWAVLFITPCKVFFFLNWCHLLILLLVFYFLTRNSYKLKLSNGERRKRKKDR